MNVIFKFVANYLKDRLQRVVLDNALSEYHTVNSDVPQGSILGPLLFVPFINDISTVISPGTNISASMLTILKFGIKCNPKTAVKFTNWHRLPRKLKTNLKAKTNLMRFHPDKCKVVTIISNRNRLAYLSLSPFSRFSYTINNVTLNYEKSEVDLGVTINDQFTWSDHH